MIMKGPKGAVTLRTVHSIHPITPGKYRPQWGSARPFWALFNWDWSDDQRVTSSELHSMTKIITASLSCESRTDMAVEQKR